VRSDEGKAVGLDAVEMVLLEVSARLKHIIQPIQSACLSHTFVLRAADFAGQVSFAAGVGFQKVAAVGTEDERSNGGHVCSYYLIT